MKRMRPDLQFDGYNEQWKQEKFSDVFSVLNNNSFSRDKLNFSGGEYLNIHYGDVLTEYGRYLDPSKNGIPYISDDELASKYKNAILKDGDIVFADTAEDETVGKCTEIGEVRDKKIVSGLHTIPCRPKREFAPKYLGFYLNSDAFHDKLLPLMQGVKVTSISKTGLLDTDVSLSPIEEEQKKIGQFLYNLDILYEEEKRRIEKIKTLKISLLEKLYPQDDNKNPELRFAGFEGNWQKYKLGDVLSFQNGFNGGRELYGKGVAFISVMDILNNQFITYDSIRGKAVVSDEELERFSVRYGDVLFQRSSENFEDAGRSNVYVDNKKAAIFGGFVIRGRQIAFYNPKFMKYLLDTKTVRNQITRKAQGAQHVNVSQETLQDVIIFMPSPDEQSVIEKCLFSVDNLINLYELRAEKLEKIKNACMKKMFI